MSKRQAKASYWQDAPMPRDQLVLITESLEDRIPGNHPVRLLDEVLSSIDWSEWESEYHGKFGQPPIHPSVMCKVLIFGMLRRIRSSRQIEYSLGHSIDFIWLASGRSIDHTTLSEFRRKNQKQIQNVYRQIVCLAVEMGVAKLSELCIDGTRVAANATRFKTLKADKVEELLKELNGQIAKAMDELESNDSLDELFDDGQSADQLPEELRDMNSRKEKLDAALAKLREMEKYRRRDGIDPKKNPAQLPTADQDSRILPNKEGGYGPNYTPMVVSETESGFVVCCDVLIGNVEHIVMEPMIDRVESDYCITVDTMLADGAYGTGPNLNAMEQRGVELLSPPSPSREVKDNPAIREDLTEPVAAEDVDKLPISRQTKRFDKQAFVFDAESDCYYCPAGKPMPRLGVEKARRSGGVIIEVTTYCCKECSGCELAKLCRANPESKLGRQVTRDGFEEVRDRQRDRMATEESKTRYNVRQHFGETPFAVLKGDFGLRQFLLRGIEGVKTEWTWACTAFNMKKLISLMAAMRTTSSTESEKLLA